MVLAGFARGGIGAAARCSTRSSTARPGFPLFVEEVTRVSPALPTARRGATADPPRADHGSTIPRSACGDPAERQRLDTPRPRPPRDGSGSRPCSDANSPTSLLQAVARKDDARAARRPSMALAGSPAALPPGAGRAQRNLRLQARAGPRWPPTRPCLRAMRRTRRTGAGSPRRCRSASQASRQHRPRSSSRCTSRAPASTPRAVACWTRRAGEARAEAVAPTFESHRLLERAASRCWPEIAGRQASVISLENPGSHRVRYGSVVDQRLRPAGRRSKRSFARARVDLWRPSSARTFPLRVLTGIWGVSPGARRPGRPPAALLPRFPAFSPHPPRAIPSRRSPGQAVARRARLPRGRLPLPRTSISRSARRLFATEELRHFTGEHGHGRMAPSTPMPTACPPSGTSGYPDRAEELRRAPPPSSAEQSGDPLRDRDRRSAMGAPLAHDRGEDELGRWGAPPDRLIAHAPRAAIFYLWLAAGSCGRGGALLALGRADEGMATAPSGGSGSTRPMGVNGGLCLLLDLPSPPACLQQGNVDEGPGDRRRRAEASAGRWSFRYHESELLRLAGRAARATAVQAEAGTPRAWRAAIDLAKRQTARIFFELRPPPPPSARHRAASGGAGAFGPGLASAGAFARFRRGLRGLRDLRQARRAPGGARLTRLARRASCRAQEFDPRRGTTARAARGPSASERGEEASGGLRRVKERGGAPLGDDQKVPRGFCRVEEGDRVPLVYLGVSTRDLNPRRSGGRAQASRGSGAPSGFARWGEGTGPLVY